jgi:hypothetical protein
MTGCALSGKESQQSSKPANILEHFPELTSVESMIGRGLSGRETESHSPQNLLLPTFAGKVGFGGVDATSAIDGPRLRLIGVARKAWTSPWRGSLITTVMPL